MGRLRGGSRDGLVQVWRNRGPEASAVQGAKLGSDEAPRRGKRAKSQNGGTVGELAPSWAEGADHY